MTEEKAEILKLNARINELELRLRATIETYGDFLIPLLEQADIITKGTPREVIFGRIDAVLSRLQKE